MSRVEIDLDPVSHLTTDAIGQPGQRVFYLQGRQNERVVTLLIEKVQIQSLAMGLDDFLKEINERYPGLPEALDDYDEKRMRILPPVDPVFRVGEIGLGYDADRDLVCLIAREILSGDMKPDDASVARFWVTRSQMRALTHWGMDVASHGRPICPQCGEPMDPEGHFCPKKNGHKH
ncbi:conserved hypothetical protein [Longilinea arvoryzae]|uniref:DUF3090 domain-containing protein n=1 Tax=Longilinea arvoryzae TaxID=360412 RepID=A0A0S7BCE1_9CHLR|nr:DUF3090 domain-containing protein [Longilinea arvoryzae]GAP15399.1 conserved hypothetical protein [Longilinea arvoryzae]